MRKKPLITSLILAGVITFPVATLGLGLGKLSVQSGLGQPLSAQIELSSAQKEELDSLRARVADPSVYRDNSAQYVGALARARVTVEQGPNNVPYLKVSTPQAINEPYLDLIVEVNWATGRLVRNYTFLLDPPGAVDAQAVEPAPMVRAQTSAPARNTNARPQAAAPSATQPAAPSGAGAAGAAGSKGGDGASTYAVKRGDTLSKIANEYKPADVSLEQMLVALFKSNESAFDGGNMNRLRSGQIINLPPSDQVTAVAPTEASQLVKIQASDWRSYRDRVAGAAPISSGDSTRQAMGGKIGTVVEEKAPAVQPGRDQLRVSRENGKGAAQAEDAASRDKALRDANARVAELEKTVRDLQKAAELKNQTMSELQARADAARGKAAEPPKPEPMKIEPKAATPPVVATAPAAPPTPPAAVAPAAPAVVAPPIAPAPAAKAPETVPKAPEPKAATPSPTPAPAPTPSPAVKVEPKATTAPTKKGAEPSFIDDLFGNTPIWAIGGGALVVLAGIAGIVAARRRKTTKFEDSIISGTDIKTNTVFGSTGGGVVNTGDNSLASDFSREGLGNIDTDEVDPIAEAEVYLAYGRDAQAEEILKDALKKDAQRQEIYFKLLEIHAQHNKPSAFETVASELYSVSGGKGEVWHKATALGRQLDPSNPMYAEGAGDSAFAMPAVGAKAADIAAGETHVFSVPPELKPEPQHTSTPLDFTLDDDISLSPTSAEVAPAAKSPAAILAGAAQEVAKSTKNASEPVKDKLAAAAASLAGGAAALATGAAHAKTPSDHAASRMLEPVSFEPESIPKFDLDFKLDGPSSLSPMMQPKQTPFPEPEPVLISSPPPAPQLSRPAAAIELDKLDLAFDPQRSTFEDPTPSVLDGQWHDAATKLDLAKAYQEMGDVEGAREILQEVLHEGDEQQKAEAQTLLSRLA